MQLNAAAPLAKLFDCNHATLHADALPKSAMPSPRTFAAGVRSLHGLAPNEVYATVYNDSLAVCLSPPSVGGEQDDACIALQLAVTGLRCFYTNEKYERFRRTNKAMSA